MLKRNITYTDYDGVEKTEEFYFNLNEMELVELEAEFDGGLEQNIKDIVAASNGKQIISLFKQILLKSYGVKSEDGRRFIKSEQLSEEFSQTAAFPVLYMELATSADAGADFVKGVLPSSLSSKVDAEIDKLKTDTAKE